MTDKRKKVKCWVLCRPEGTPIASTYTVRERKRPTKEVLEQWAGAANVDYCWRKGYRMRRAILTVEDPHDR